MGIQTGNRQLGLFDADGLAAGIRNADHVQHPILLHPVAGLPEGNVGRNVHHPQILVSQHHGVLAGAGVLGVDLGVTGVVMAGHVDGFLAQGVGDGGVHLSLHGQVNDLHHIPEGSLAAQGGGAQPEGLRMLRIAGDVLRLHDAQVVHVDDTVLKISFLHRVDGANPHVDAGNRLDGLHRVFHAAEVADHQRTAPVIDRFVRQSLDGDLRAVAEGIAHGNAQNRFLLHLNYLPFYSLIAYTKFQRL